ncbi:hypothetical protein RB614_05610 [Phytohabitans sp. ZYX-F-186]|uniref:Uncharacterized protein n=1 Tax=Phytohabitans maris TaxID=3071409 RepID=A0ABU0ZDH4_9ACTN|nr:hypothetical protein [Phytohabitans sp. ZYX-F-186]MDQ7903997.1 hypothetical protein [Phytohabitans sp. ZYX-F-186]
MDDTERGSADHPRAGAVMGRRAFFGRTLLATGAVAALAGLTGCPGGDGDDDDDDEDDDD